MRWLNEQDGVRYKLDAFRSSETMREPGAIVVGPNGVFGFHAIASGLIKQARKGGGFREKERDLLWARGAEKIEVSKFTGELGQQDELTARSLDHEAPLSGKKIALIGCGTLGSHLSRGLIQLGAGQDGSLLLADHDYLTPGNLGRHTLSYRDLYRNKATALFDQLGAEFPDAKIEAVEAGAQTVWDRFAGFDLIVDVTGDEQFSNALNAHGLSRRSTERPFPPIVFGMILGNGIAAHSFVARYGEKDACYRCLKPDFDRPWRNGPSEKTLAQTEMVARPCGSATFIPFSVSATYFAAGLVLEQVSDVFICTAGTNLRMIAIDQKTGGPSGSKLVQPHDRCPACKETPTVG